MWLSGLGVTLQTYTSLVRFPVRAHVWVSGQVPQQEACEEQSTHVSLPLFLTLPVSLKISKYNLESKRSSSIYPRATVSSTAPPALRTAVFRVPCCSDDVQEDSTESRTVKLRLGNSGCLGPRSRQRYRGPVNRWARFGKEQRRRDIP